MPAGPKPPAHPLAALLSIGGMSLLLGAVVDLLGLSRKIDSTVQGWISSTGLSGEFHPLPTHLPWLWTVPMTVGLTAAMLGSRLTWRRAVLWTTALLLTASWAPVLALAGLEIRTAMPLLALFWCGLWSMIYAARHQEPGEP